MRLLLEVLADQVGLRMQPLEVAADCDRLCQTGPVVEHEYRQTARKVLLEHLRPTVLSGEQVALLHLDLESFFSDKDPEPSWIRRQLEIVYLHNGCNLKLIGRSRQRQILGQPRAMV